MKRMLFLLPLLATILFSNNLAASGIQSGKDVIIDEPVNKNITVAGGTIRVEAPIGGDLICAGGEIRINNTVGQDILAAGGDIQLNKAGGQDVRLIGGKVRVSDNVPGDLVITGGEIFIEAGVTIGGDLIVAGGKVMMEGTVKGNADVMAGELFLSGMVEGELNAKGGRIDVDGQVKGVSKIAADHIHLGSTARFGGDVSYWSKSGAVDFGSALAGSATATFTESLKMKHTEWKQKSRLLQKRLAPAVIAYRIAAGALIIGFLTAFFSGFFARHAGGLRRKTGAYMGVGTLYLIGIPVLAGIAAATIIGIPAAVALGGVYSASIAVAGALTAVVAAHELSNRLGRNWSKGQFFWASTGIFIVLKVLGAVPFFGSLAVFVLTAVAFGYVIQIMRGKVKPEDKAPAGEELIEDIV
ncbi:MAG: polymer-forming cytoskeletal protein [Saprospiraceae bacterium]|nr:polymer-forming cytoskeletal protein [Saprospiraceae bacterium]